MIDSEIYPVSFFSQAFDLMHKIQSDFHTLEADQVELFASQMKKHQALILSIHRQMRHIEEAQPAGAVMPETVQQPVANPAPPKKVEIARQPEDKQKKGSFLNRLGISREPAVNKEQKPAANAESATNAPSPVMTKDAPGETSSKTIPAGAPVFPPDPRGFSGTPPVKEQTDTPPIKPASDIIEAPIEPLAEKRPPRPAPKEKSTITLPEMPVEKTIRTPPRPVAPEIAGTGKAPEAKRSNGIPAEGSAPPSVNDVIEKRKLSDLRKAFSLNDRFRYRRELFGGSEEIMNKVITTLNNKTSYKESMLFLEEKLHWDFTDPTVKDFIKVLEIRFL
ncbi:MAG: hypothetical protein LBL07_05900 [Tannerella sp.]|nr:hypothetical protein [Tannerella sp.]